MTNVLRMPPFPRHFKAAALNVTGLNYFNSDDKGLPGAGAGAAGAPNEGVACTGGVSIRRSPISESAAGAGAGTAAGAWAVGAAAATGCADGTTSSVSAPG